VLEEVFKIKEIFNELIKRHNPHQVFNDFIELSALSISNSVDFGNLKTREERYTEISKRYNGKELKLFCNAFGELAIKMESPKDILGELLMELEEGNKMKGQYFTPFHICLLSAEIALNEEKLKESGYITVNEPAAGGGALIIALYSTIKKRGYDPQKQLKVIAGDLDLKSVFMCYVQLSLLGVAAIVKHSNALSCETFSEWKTPEWILSGWEYR